MQRRIRRAKIQTCIGASNDTTHDLRHLTVLYRR
jgi:hypothetical protein